MVLGAMTAVWAVLGDEDAEMVREELQAGRRRDACGVLLTVPSKSGQSCPMPRVLKAS